VSTIYKAAPLQVAKIDQTDSFSNALQTVDERARGVSENSSQAYSTYSKQRTTGYAKQQQGIQSETRTAYCTPRAPTRYSNQDRDKTFMVIVEEG
jgi:hypothetical protein